jgi:hypothetical protein
MAEAGHGIFIANFLWKKARILRRNQKGDLIKN